jgi:hypothetical protein
MSLLRRLNLSPGGLSQPIEIIATTTGSTNVPLRARRVVIELWGAGGGGGGALINLQEVGGGGGAGGYSKITKTLIPSDYGKTVSYTISSTGGAAGSNALNAPNATPGSAGGTSTLTMTSFSFGSVSLTCNGGGGGTEATSGGPGSGGAGGTASGGDTNLTGGSGGSPTAGSPAVAAISNRGKGGSGGIPGDTELGTPNIPAADGYSGMALITFY